MTLLSKSLINARQNAFIDRMYEHDATIGVAPTGGGKTVTTLTAIQELIAWGHLTRVVVCAPAKVVPNWAKEAKKWEHLHSLRVVTLDGNAASRSSRLKTDFDVAVISTNSFDWLARLKNHGCNGVVVDELSKSCGKQTAALKAKSFGGVFKWRVGLTATPVSENFEKLFKMVRIMDSRDPLGRNFSKFQAEYFTGDFMGFNFTLNPGADKLILDKVKHLIHLVEDTKAVDLPPINRYELRFNMPADTRDVYKDMKKHMVAGDVEAVNAAVKSGKLRQIASGYLYREDDEPLQLDRVRVQALQQWFKTCGHRGVVFYEHTEQLRHIQEAFSPGLLACVYGGMGKVALADSFRRFHAGDARLLVAQYNSMSHGVDGLQDICSAVCFYHPLWSRDATEQAEGRLWRTGQQQPVKVTTLICNDTLDDLVLRRVDDKGEFMRLFKAHLSR